MQMCAYLFSFLLEYKVPASAVKETAAAVSRLEGNITTIMHTATSMGNADRTEQSTAKQHPSIGNAN